MGRPGSGKKLGSVSGDIELSKVSFSYPTRKDIFVFKTANLEVNAGEIIGVFGPSGR